MNQNILESIDKIELCGIFSEMEVCAALAANYEKQAVIIEHALVPSDFDFYMESKSSDDKKDEDIDETLGIKKTEDPDEDPKAVWLRKVWQYIKKFSLIGIRLIERLIVSFKKSKVAKVFESAANKNKVPADVLSVAKASTKLVVFEYLLSVFLVVSVSDTKIYRWCVSTMHTLADPKMIPEKFASVDDLVKAVAASQPVKPILKGNIAEYYNIIDSAYKKIDESSTHIPELFEILADFTGKLKKFKYDLKIAEYKDIKENKKVSADRMHNVNEMLSKLEKITHDHSKASLKYMRNVAKLVDDNKTVSIEAAMHNIDKDDDNIVVKDANKKSSTTAEDILKGTKKD